MNKTSPLDSESQDPRMRRNETPPVSSKKTTSSSSKVGGGLCCIPIPKKRSTKSGNKVRHQEKDPQEDERRTRVIQEQPHNKCKYTNRYRSGLRVKILVRFCPVYLSYASHLCLICLFCILCVQSPVFCTLSNRFFQP
ncbi:uncharacterized protein RB166_015266 [Leptodactylus fuscus]